MGTILSQIILSENCLAATTDLNTITTDVNSIKNFLVGIVVAIGAIIVIKEVFELGSSIKSQDSAGIAGALKGIIGGGVMVAVGAVVKLFGA